MKPNNEQNFDHQVDLSGLYPHLTPEELSKAEYNLTRYMDIVRRIYERTNNLTPLEELYTLTEDTDEPDSPGDPPPTSSNNEASLRSQ